MSGRSLSARLARLETSSAVSVVTSAYLITCVHHEADPPGDIIAAQSASGRIVYRIAGECIDDFSLRAGQATAQRIMVALYANSVPDTEFESNARATQANPF